MHLDQVLIALAKNSQNPITADGALPKEPGGWEGHIFPSPSYTHSTAQCTIAGGEDGYMAAAPSRCNDVCPMQARSS